MKPEKLSKALSKIFEGIEELKNSFEKKEFTIDGRLVGDIGEAIAERDYCLDVFEKLVKGYDAEAYDGKKIQIKATFKNKLTFKEVPDYYLGLKILTNGTAEEIYNGPGKYIANYYGHWKGFGEELLSFPISILRSISNNIPEEEKIKKRESL